LSSPPFIPVRAEERKRQQRNREGNEDVFVEEEGESEAGQTRSEVSDSSSVGLLGPSEIGLRDEDVAHREHTETSQLLGGVL